MINSIQQAKYIKCETIFNSETSLDFTSSEENIWILIY